jgi:hypothetical protein
MVNCLIVLFPEQRQHIIDAIPRVYDNKSSHPYAELVRSQFTLTLYYHKRLYRIYTSSPSFLQTAAHYFPSEEWMMPNWKQ